MHSHLLACGITFHLFYLFLTYRVVWKPSFYSKNIFAATSLCLSISTLEQHSGPLHLLDGKTIELYNWRYHSKCHLPSSLSFSMPLLDSLKWYQGSYCSLTATKSRWPLDHYLTSRNLLQLQDVSAFSHAQPHFSRLEDVDTHTRLLPHISCPKYCLNIPFLILLSLSTSPP